MSRTLRSYKGVDYIPSSTEQKPKQKKTKFMGFTSGTHSRKEDDQYPVKGEDYIKYGYPARFEKINNIKAERHLSKQICKKYLNFKEIEEKI